MGKFLFSLAFAATLLADQRLDDQREAAGEIIAGTAVEPQLRVLLAGNNSEAVVLDLVQP